MKNQKIIKNKLIIFDLDGVLINSLPNMRHSLKCTNNELGLSLNFDLYKNYLGLPFIKILKKIGVKSNFIKIKKRYSYYSKKNIHKISINKKLQSQLKNLKKNYILTVFTSKDKERSKLILKKYDYFSKIISADDTKKGKPNPEGIYKLLLLYNIRKNNCIYIGDSIFDYQAAKKAKIKYLNVSWGYDRSLMKIRKIKVINNFSQIKNFL